MKKNFLVLPFLLTTLRSIRNPKTFSLLCHKHLIKQKIKSVRLRDLDISSPFLDSKEVKKLDKLHEDLHFPMWRCKPFQ